MKSLDEQDEKNSPTDEIVGSTDGLARCPFCGSPAKMSHTNFIYCADTVNCCAQMESGDSGDDTESLTIAAWNKRANAKLSGAPNGASD